MLSPFSVRSGGVVAVGTQSPAACRQTPLNGVKQVEPVPILDPGEAAVGGEEAAEALAFEVVEEPGGGIDVVTELLIPEVDSGGNVESALGMAEGLDSFVLGTLEAVEAFEIGGVDVEIEASFDGSVAGRRQG